MDQYRAFKENQNMLVKKLQNLGQQIHKKQIQFAELAQNVVNSMISNKDNEEDQNQFLKQQFKLSDEELRMAADADFMSNVIG